jgi:hypothetical protein
MFKAPAFMFPTKTVLMDDDHFFAELVAQSLSSKLVITPLFDTEVISQQKSSDLISVDQPSIDKPTLKQQIVAGIHAQQMPLDGLVSVIITDEHMGSLRGSTLLSELKSPFVRKILISNFIMLRPVPEVNQLRNRGLIHAVLDKTNNLFDQLPDVVQKSKIDFFTLLSQELFSLKMNPLADTEFAALFVKLINEFNPDFISPAYNLQMFTFSKQAGKTPLKLFVSTKEQIEGLLDSHRVESAPKSIQSMLKSYEFALAHHDPMTLDGYCWEKYLRPAKKIPGQLTEYIFCTEMEANYV